MGVRERGTEKGMTERERGTGREVYVRGSEEDESKERGRERDAPLPGCSFTAPDIFFSIHSILVGNYPKAIFLSVVFYYAFVVGKSSSLMRLSSLVLRVGF